MADTEISKLPPLSKDQLRPDDVLPIADVSLVETKKVRADDLVLAGINTLPDGSLDPDILDWKDLSDGTLPGSVIQDRSIAAVKLQANSLTADEIAANAIGSSELANGAVDGPALQDGVVSTDKIANAAVGPTQLQADLPGSILASGTIDEAQLANESVTAAKLGPQSVGNSALADGAVTDAKVTDVNGSKIADDSIGARKFDPSGFSNGLQVTGAGSNKVVGHINQQVASSRNGISWDGNGHITGSAALEPSDLPPATDTALGGIIVPPTSGLTVDGVGNIDHVTLVTAGSQAGISFDEHGHITGVTGEIAAADLPLATTTTPGAVSVPVANDNPLDIASNGRLTHATTGNAAATGLVSLNVDQYGHVSGGNTVLNASQVPGLDASKITSGQFPTARIADDAITKEKLADYSVSFIQEAEPSILDGVHAGMFWYQESTGQLRCYNQNSWMPVGFGRLAQENLRFCGTINATTGLVETVNDNGRTAGLQVGEALPAATDELSGVYLVIDEPGSGIIVDPGVDYDEGDWILCVDEATGWIRINVSAGGSGTPLIRLNDLLDVDINSPQPGDALIFDPNTNNWVNRTTAIKRLSFSPAFDGTTTTFTLSEAATTLNNLTLVVSGVQQEPGVDFTVTSGSNQLTFSSPPPAGSDYFLLMTQNVTGGGGGGGGTDLPPGTAAEEFLQWNNTLGAWGPSSELDGGSF